MGAPNLSAVILTFNEELHLERCIQSINAIATSILVVDSFSTDGTLEIAHRLGAQVRQNAWVNYATQFNWALDHLDQSANWVLRLDADEVVTPELAAAIPNLLLSAPASVAGFTVNRRIYFLDKWIRHGGIYPIQVVRLWRAGKGRCEQRWMDEHIVLDGEARQIDADICDRNLNDIGWWTAKHNAYATREAIDSLILAAHRQSDMQGALSQQAARKRWMKENVYSRLPRGLRAVVYFLYRYFFRFGFLDGWQGFAFHVLQGLWYRFIVDVKIYEIERLMKDENMTLAEAVNKYSGFNIPEQMR